MARSDRWTPCLWVFPHAFRGDAPGGAKKVSPKTLTAISRERTEREREREREREGERERERERERPAPRPPEREFPQGLL